MSHDLESRRSCERAAELRIRQAEGPLPEADGRFLSEHLAICARCRAESELLGVLRATDQDPVPPLDDISRTRAIQSVLARRSTRAAGPAERREDRTEPSWPAGSRRWRWAAAAAVLVVGLAGGYLALRPSGGDDVRPRRLALDPPAAARARLLLVQGDVRSGAASLQAGSELAEGAPLRLVDGEAVVAVDRALALLVSGTADLRATGLRSGQVNLAVASGTVFGHLQPVPGRPRLRLVTPQGRVEITGTVFELRVSPAGTEVEVLRGEVVVTDGKGGSWSVRTRQGLRLGAAAAVELTPGQIQALDGKRRRLEWFEAGRYGLVEVHSRPSGAEVTVDGLPIGRTPMTAAFPTGRRLIEVTLDGFAPVLERLDVQSGERYARDLELRRNPPPPPVPPAPADRPAGAGPTGIGPRPGPATSGDDEVGSLLEEAQRRMVRRDWTGAVSTYRTLVRKHPRRLEALSARVSLGILLLDHLGRPAAALDEFGAYLRGRRSGGLAPEAAYGRARALRALGRVAEETAALRLFLVAYPDAVQAKAVRQRLTALAPRSPAAPPR